MAVFYASCFNPLLLFPQSPTKNLNNETKSKSTRGEPRRESKSLARRKSTSKEDLENEVESNLPFSPEIIFFTLPHLVKHPARGNQIQV